MIDPEKLALQQKFAADKKPSMKRRDESHDYTARRMYMITIEIEGRRPLFGQVEGNPFADKRSADAPHIVLSELGQAVQAEWVGISHYYPQIEVLAIQMMPDHLHGIIFVREALPVHLGQVIAGFKAGCRREQKKLEAAKPPRTEKPMAQSAITTSERAEGNRSGGFFGESVVACSSPYATVSPSLRAVSPVSQTVSDTESRPLFALGYNDLILRSYDELQVWKNYLRDNPRRLLLKRARPEWLRPFFGLRVGTAVYNGVGNRALLQAPRRIAVKVTRRLSQSEIEEVKERYLAEAKQGAVLVSPAISPGEKQVMRAAFDVGYPTIVLMDNGFTPLSKPHGEQFEACAEGKLLMLSPWEHHNERHKITIQQCRQLNYLAIELCLSLPPDPSAVHSTEETNQGTECPSPQSH